MVEVDCGCRADDGGAMHACVGPTSSSCADNSTPSSISMSYISLFKKSIIVTSLTDVSRPITTVAHQRRLRPAHHHCATIVAMG
jgi:hypothetical protein